MSETENTISTGLEMSLAEAERICENIVCWVGWERWDRGMKSIVLDGEFSPCELMALSIVLTSQTHEVLST